ncbi:MAG: SEC-C domain-containing protein, partial [Alkaliphilus sp.]|nr:SEC-C domain-containing protein [Alkaliphilus sp.]
FKLLDYFVSNSDKLLVMFKLEEQITQRKRDNIKIVGRNEKCSCGSEKKFKRCCGKDIYYKHIHYIIKFENKVHFEIII